MARPIRETPVLTGDDAIRFTREMKQVEQMPKEERAENRRKLEEACQSLLKHLTLTM